MVHKFTNSDEVNPANSLLTSATSDITNPPSGPRSVSKGVQWWNVNVPQEEWTIECPPFLYGQPEKNMHILATRDEDHPRMSWAEVTHLINTNHIDQFHRMPSDLRRYIKYCEDIKRRYGSILRFIQQQRLTWSSLDTTNDEPFTNEADYKILYNDWPYAIDEEVIHLIVWTKFALEDDPVSGELTQENKKIVERFITNTFCTSKSDSPTMSRESLAWFKNWKSLKSVHALEHFHVMLYRPPSRLIEQITHYDRPICEQFELK